MMQPVSATGMAERLSAAGTRISVAAPLTLAGGSLDAFTYVGHGHVFANAMTGNVALMGVAAAAGDWAQAFRHMPPLLAFTAAVLLVQFLRLDAWRGRLPELGVVCLMLEIVVLTAAAFGGPALPDEVLIPAISFVATLQTSSFDRLESLTYTSVMTTGNLRRLLSSAVAGFLPRRDLDALRQARLLGVICACFLLGAVIGAFATTRLHDVALLVPVALLAGAMGRLIWLARYRSFGVC